MAGQPDSAPLAAQIPAASAFRADRADRTQDRTSLRHHLTTRWRRPQPIDMAMIVAAAGSFFHHIHGPGLVSLLVWWTIWAVLWVVWGRRVGSLVGAAVSLIVLALMIVGPRTDLGFQLNRGCFDTKAQAGLTGHAPEPNRNTDYHGDDRCGLMSFSLQTQELHVREPGTQSLPTGRAMAAVFRHAGETDWGLFDGNGMIYSPAGEPFCTSGVVGDTHGCRTERVGNSDWYYFSYSTNIN